jgi:ubiquinone biosynthesis protein Coq4
MFTPQPIPAEFAINIPGAEFLWINPDDRKRANHDFWRVVTNLGVRLNDPVDVGPFSFAASFALQNN